MKITVTVLRRLFVFFFTLLTVANANACINGEIKKLKNGTWIFQDDGMSRVPHGHEFFDVEDHFAGDLRSLDSLYHATGDPDYLSDKGLY